MLKLQGLKIQIGKILKSKGLEKTKYERYSYTKGYGFDKDNYSDESTTYLYWENANMIQYKTDSEMIEYIYNTLVKNGLGDYLQPLGENDKIIKFKNVEFD